MNPKTIFKILFTLALVGLVVVLAGPGNIVRAFRGAELLLILLALPLTPVCIFFKAYRWHLLARSRIPGLGFPASFKSYMAGLTLAVITPMSAGELARGHHLDPRRGAELIGLVTVDKFLDLAAVGTYGCLGFIYLFPAPIKVLCALAILAMTAGWLFLRPAAGALQRLLRAAPESRLGRFFAAVKDVSIPLIFTCLSVAFINFAFYYLQVYLVVYAFAKHSVALGAIAFFPTITLSTIIPYAIGGLGVRELTAALLLSRYGITQAAASSAFFAHFVIIMILPGLVGALWVGRVALPSAGAEPGPDKET
jgi:uncharacterized membrane protein YbhN (UPF0104 family)